MTSQMEIFWLELNEDRPHHCYQKEKKKQANAGAQSLSHLASTRETSRVVSSGTASAWPDGRDGGQSTLLAYTCTVVRVVAVRAQPYAEIVAGWNSSGQQTLQLFLSLLFEWCRDGDGIPPLAAGVGDSRRMAALRHRQLTRLSTQLDHYYVPPVWGKVA